MTSLPHEFEIFHRLPALLGDADDVLGFVIFIVIGAVLLIFKAIASAQSNTTEKGAARRQIARSIQAKRSEIQERAGKIRRQQSATDGPAAIETPRDRRSRLQRERLLQRQGRADDARTEYDLIRQRRQTQQAQAPRAQAPQARGSQLRSPVLPQVKRSPPPVQRPHETRPQPVARPVAQPRPQAPPRQPALVTSRLSQAARETPATTAPIKATSVVTGGIGKGSPAAPKAFQSLAATLRRRMSGNQLREYLVASEVLGKPIALREPGSG